MAQITARLSTDIRAHFDRYAAEVGLDASELARLLIVKEMRARRPLSPAKSPSSAAGKPAKRHRERKLTAHFHLAKTVAEFGRYARAQGLSNAGATRLIVERELRERWLASAFTWTHKGSRF